MLVQKVVIVGVSGQGLNLSEPAVKRLTPGGKQEVGQVVSYQLIYGVWNNKTRSKVSCEIFIKKDFQKFYLYYFLLLCIEAGFTS